MAEKPDKIKVMTKRAWGVGLITVLLAAACSSGAAVGSESAASTTGAPTTAAALTTVVASTTPATSTSAASTTTAVATTTTATTVTQTTTTATTVTPTTIATTTPVPIGVDVDCSALATHWYCVAAGAPVAPVSHGMNEFWGRTVGYTPEVFCASDLDEMVCRETTVALLVAMGEWGNYGPLEYWVMGVDESASMDLVEVHCDRRDERGQRNRTRCLEREHDDGMMAYQRLTASAVAEGRPRENACHCGNREWGIHWLSSAMPFGYTDHFQVSGADARTTQFHEYFHAVQHSHLMTTDHWSRYDGGGLGPVWFGEGGADWMAQSAIQRLLADGTLPEVNTEGRGSFNIEQNMHQRLREGLESLAECPGANLGDIGYDTCNRASYSLGAWAHAWLADRFGSDHLLDVFYPALDAMGWEGAFIRSYAMTPDEFYNRFDEFLALDLEDQLAILPTGGAETAQPASTTTPPPTTTTSTTTTTTSHPPAIRQTGPAAPTTTISPSETAKEHLERIGVNVPKSDPQHWILFSESIPDDLVQQNAEIMDLVVGIVGGYDRYVHITYELDDPNTENLRILNELGVKNGTLASIDDIHEIRGCLAGFTAFERWDGKHEYSFCMQPNPLTDPIWENDRENQGPVGHRYGIFHGWVHEYFHHYQKSHLFGRAMAMVDDCCGLTDPVNAPAWWVEGAAIVFPDVFMKEYFNDLSWTREHDLSLDEVTGDRIGSILNLRWDDDYARGRKQVKGLDSDSRCTGVGPDEEYRHTEKCSHRHWFLMNVYLAYLTSYQTLWVNIPADMWELGFDGSFEKNVGMTVDEFYDSYNAFMSAGDPDDPPPPGFFPTQPLSELVDFWAIKSG